ncbi:hypothetical protein [Marinifilum sp. D714]|uniref:hypothetical protein n=1 Tax=Marinifilum sp. D714 TaxID=2937523 RepID=UPI0027CBBD05|nr:hypothetical protein [Marinifilum sp. D714]MDQ2178444.1 hypothetical protein [Marinifilum sp. D714]
MNLSKILRIIPSILFLAYSAYILYDVLTNSSMEWKIYFALLGLIFYLLLFLYMLWALFFKRKLEVEEKQMKRTSSLAFGLLMGAGIGILLYVNLELKFILLIAPVFGILYALILTRVEKSRINLY